MINTMKTIRKAALLLLFVSVIGFASGCNETAPAEPLDYVGYETGEIDAEYDKNLFFRNEYNLESADPSVIYVSEGEWAGWFFATGTNSGSGFKIYRSQNLTDWESAGEGFVRPTNIRFRIISESRSPLSREVLILLSAESTPTEKP